MKQKKPKVYIPTYKIIITCGIVITVCMVLLLITNVVSISKSKAIEDESISQRYEEENKSEKKSTLSLEDVRDTNQKVTTTSNQKNTASSSRSDEKNSKKDKKETTVAAQKPAAASKTEASASKPAAATSSKTSTTTTASTAKPAATAPKSDSQTSSSSPAVTKPAAAVTTVTPPSPASKTDSSSSASNTTTIKVTDFGFPQAVNHAQLVFLFDDGGQNLTQLDKFLKLPFPITIAVLPRLVHSKEAADKIRASGNELMLHQPMQALNSKVNPGPGAITPDMSDNDIITTLFQNINEIGPIAGMNNHEGSAITADAEKMSVILKTASENGIYFLDSRTNVDTQVPYVAHELGYSYYERNIFLDNTKVRSDILKEINKGIALANKNGVVIMIGHIWSADVLPDILNEIYPELKKKGYTFTTVSKSKGKK